jgi:hypothetical protein
VVPAGPKVPATAEGTQLAAEVNASVVLASDAKLRLIAEIVNRRAPNRLGRAPKGL